MSWMWPTTGSGSSSRHHQHHDQQLPEASGGKGAAGQGPHQHPDHQPLTLNLTNTMVDPIFDFQFRVILIGDSGVGKSSLLRKFTVGSFAEVSDPTVGVDFFARLVRVDDATTIKLQLWDTAGQERFRSITKAYYRNSVGVLLVYDIADRVSFEHVEQWMTESRRHIEPHQATFALVGCKLDHVDQRQVKVSEAKAFAKTHNMEHFETSSKKGIRVEAPFQHLAQVIHDKIKTGEYKLEDGWDGIKRSYFGSSRYHYGAEEVPAMGEGEGGRGATTARPTLSMAHGEAVHRQNCC